VTVKKERRRLSKPKKTLLQKKKQKLKTLTDDAIITVRRDQISAFTKGWLGQALGVSKSETSQVISQLKKDEFIHNASSNYGDFQDPWNRGKYFRVRGAELNPEWKWANGKRPNQRVSRGSNE
jgi:hypothetical protein